MSEVLAIIPARGGSKGIPRKNLAMCAGRPLVDWVLEAASGSRLIKLTILSSDDDEILDRGRRFWGVAPLRRAAELAQDETPTEAVMREVIERPGIGRPEADDLIMLLQPTSPLTETHDIDAAINLLREDGADSVVSVVPSHAFLWSGRRYGSPSYDPRERPRRQEMEGRQFEENGAIYVTTYAQWASTGCRIGGRVDLYVMGEQGRLQVDSPADLEMASLLLERRIRERAGLLHFMSIEPYAACGARAAREELRAVPAEATCPDCRVIIDSAKGSEKAAAV